MKKILVLLLFFVVHFSFAQKLVGVYTSTYTSKQGPGIFEYNLSTNKYDNKKPIPASLGIPDEYRSGICHLNGKVYGITYNENVRTSYVYEYDLNNKEYKIILTSQKGLGVDLKVSSAGLLYGSGYDTIKGVYLYELNPISTVYKEYYNNSDLKIEGASFFVLAKNDNMYFVCYGISFQGPRYLMEFDTKNKIFTMKSSSEHLPYIFMYPYVMSDIGDGKIACTSNKNMATDVWVYDYINNTEKLYQNTNLKKNYSGPRGVIIRRGKFMYIMVEGKNSVSLLSIDIETGEYTEVEDFGKIKAYRGITCFYLNDVIYAYDFDLDGMIYSYNLVTNKTVIIKEYADNTFRIESELILVK